MTASDGADSVAQFVDGDLVAARQLRASLRILADHYAGRPLGQQVERVLAGRMDFRELTRDPEFASMAHSGMQQFADQWRAMSAEEKAELLRESEEAAATLRRA